MSPSPYPLPPGRRGFRLEAPGDLEPKALVDRLLARLVLAGAFQVQRQARGPATAHLQAPAHPVGAGRALREHRARIGGQESGAEGRGHAIADFRVQAARQRATSIRRQARVVCRDHRPFTPLDAAPHAGARVSAKPWPLAPGASRSDPLAPHS